VTLNLAEMLVVKSRPSDPYGASLLLIFLLLYILLPMYVCFLC